MGSRNRKPLSDITDIHNLTPLSVLRELVSSNGICKPPVSILRSNSNSTNHKFGPESSGISNTSIGSSSVGITFNSKTVQFRQPPNAVSPTTSPEIASDSSGTQQGGNHSFDGDIKFKGEQRGGAKIEQ